MTSYGQNKEMVSDSNFSLCVFLYWRVQVSNLQYNCAHCTANKLADELILVEEMLAIICLTKTGPGVQGTLIVT